MVLPGKLIYSSAAFRRSFLTRAFLYISEYFLQSVTTRNRVERPATFYVSVRNLLFLPALVALRCELFDVSVGLLAKITV